MPFIEHCHHRTLLEVSPEDDDVELPDIKLIGKNETRGIECQATEGVNAMVCAFSSTMFLSMAVGKLLQLYKVARTAF